MIDDECANCRHRRSWHVPLRLPYSLLRVGGYLDAVERLIAELTFFNRLRERGAVLACRQCDADGKICGFELDLFPELFERFSSSRGQSPALAR